MPTILTHAVVGVAAWAALPAPWRSRPLLAACAVVPMLPDLDSIGFFAGVPYASFWGHRGFVHSLAFGALAGTSLAYLCRRSRWASGAPPWLPAVLFPLLWASHGLLDMATSGGLGVAILSPFDTERHFFPRTPIRVSPMGLKALLGTRGVAVFGSEARWVWFPSASLSVAVSGFRRLGGRTTRSKK